MPLSPIDRDTAESGRLAGGFGLNQAARPGQAPRIVLVQSRLVARESPVAAAHGK